MPIFRYFVFVGGALLLLLLAVDYVQPAVPVAQNVASTTGDAPPVIRIRSDRHLPDRVVLDTTQPTITPQAVQTAAVAAPKAAQADASSALNDMSAKARVRETFAQFIPPETKKPDVKAQVQPHFGFFNTTW